MRNIIVLAAGQSKRFKDAGFDTPKPYLPIKWRGRMLPMLHHVINTIPTNECEITIAIPETEVNLPDKSTLPPYKYVVINRSRGPADSLLQTTFRIDNIRSSSLLVMDADILNWTNDLTNLMYSFRPGVLVKKGQDASYSFVDALGDFKTIAEKKIISEYAVCGAYYFPGYAVPELIRHLPKVISDENEPYISHCLNRLSGIKTSYQCTYDPIDWGTPQAVKNSGAEIICL